MLEDSLLISMFNGFTSGPSLKFKETGCIGSKVFTSISAKREELLLLDDDEPILVFVNIFRPRESLISFNSITFPKSFEREISTPFIVRISFSISRKLILIFLKRFVFFYVVVLRKPGS